MNKNWVKINRSLLESDIWRQEPFARGQAWVDLILLANHSEGFIRARGVKITLKRGQVGRSQVELSKRWKWSRGKVKRFLDELEVEQQIEQQKNNVNSVISIVNYDKYQSSSTADSTANGQQTEQQTGGKQDTNKKNKEEIKKNKEGLPSIVDDIDKAKLKEQSEALYKSYPTRCDVRDSSTGKNSSDKEKLTSLIKLHGYEYVDRAISFYVKDCKKSATMLKNFSTLLNNLPEPPDNWSAKRIPAKFIETYVDNSGNTCANYEGDDGNMYRLWEVEPSEVRGEFFVKQDYVKQ